MQPAIRLTRPATSRGTITQSKSIQRRRPSETPSASGKASLKCGAVRLRPLVTDDVRTQSHPGGVESVDTGLDGRSRLPERLVGRVDGDLAPFADTCARAAGGLDRGQPGSDDRADGPQELVVAVRAEARRWGRGARARAVEGAARCCEPRITIRSRAQPAAPGNPHRQCRCSAVSSSVGVASNTPRRAK